MNTMERRMAIIDVLIERGYEKADNLAFEFGVSEKTIRNDVSQLSLSYPLYTVTGPYGGIYIDEKYCTSRRFINDAELKLFTKLAQGLAGEELALMQRFLKHFTKGEKR